jgi:hypothetical protein
MGQSAAEGLRRVVPALDGPARSYFGEALAILEEVIARSESAGGSGSMATRTGPAARSPVAMPLWDSRTGAR